MYYNKTTNETYTEGAIMTRRVEGGVFSGIPTPEQLQEFGFEKVQPHEPTEEERKRAEMAAIKAELASMDYLTSKYIDGEDMTEYGDWQGKRKALREQYRQLEQEIGGRSDDER